ncbi:hypothetical protein ACT18_22345 [Mycolicibacter kumamotonensis]|uniref:Mammalian cell entry protein n=1 Tax=Mycolicibacter kumamotonensis TaxID=354243 RepID=A0A1B8SA12_9MYCO|nr:hypothetical protein ACT18_22345 [Mycolicibacter kumamotonensis]
MSSARTGGKSDGAFGKSKGLTVRLSISLRGLVTGCVIAAFIAGFGTVSWLYFGARHELSEAEHRSRDYARAEEIGLDYAVDAAQVDASDFGAWKARLVKGVTPELTEKLTKAADEMEQILVPLVWKSTAAPLVAKVRSENDGVYVVDCFVGVLTQTAQSKEPVRSTATYGITIDSNRDWEISDVGGIGGVLEGK